MVEKTEAATRLSRKHLEQLTEARDQCIRAHAEYQNARVRTWLLDSVGFALAPRRNEREGELSSKHAPDCHHTPSIVAAVRERGVTRAALRSLVSVSRRSADGQPTVSRRIALLEREFGCLFLDRQSRGVKPTREGWVLLTHAVSILEAIDAAERDLMKLGRDKNRANATKARKRVREKRTAPKAE